MKSKAKGNMLPEFSGTGKKETPSSAGRRRFVGAAGLAVPVILTVKSRSVMACECFSPSAQASMNLLHSRTNRDKNGTCIGHTPGYWGNAAKNHTTQWNQVNGNNTYFSAIVNDPSAFPNLKIGDVIQLNGVNDPAQLGAHIAAAWCNMKMGWVSTNVVNQEDLVKMWAGRTLGYHPVAGVTWYASDIVTYLKTTQPY